MRKIGLHIRLSQTLCEMAQYAHSLNVPIFQCFFIHQETNQLVIPDQDQMAEFLKVWRPLFTDLYLHGSYWINLTSGNSIKIIKRELELAQKLAFTHIIIHPGSVRKGTKKNEGIARIAKHLNTILKMDYGIKIVLENSAHAGVCLGGDLHDFQILREQLDEPEKLFFCIDTAHAYVYGYNLAAEAELFKFFTLIEHTIGFDSIALIHLNDTAQKCGSKIDKHDTVGQGNLAAILPAFINFPALAKIPIITELPILNNDEELRVLQTIRSWVL